MDNKELIARLKNCGMPGSMEMRAAKALEAAQAEIAKLRKVTQSIGADGPSEDDVMQMGRNFGDWENGFNTASQLIEARIAAAAGASPAQPSQARGLSDTTRLDFLDENKGRNVFSIASNWYTRANYGQPYRKRKSLRDAVDAVINTKGTSS